MAVPTAYTEDTFARYIHDEVLQYVADAMDWGIASLSVTVPAPELTTLVVKEAVGKSASVIRVMSPDALTTVSTSATKQTLLSALRAAKFNLRNVGDTDWEEDFYYVDPQGIDGVLHYQPTTFINASNAVTHPTGAPDNFVGYTYIDVTALVEAVPAGSILQPFAESGLTKNIVVTVDANIGATTVSVEPLEESILDIVNFSVSKPDIREYAVVKIFPYLSRDVTALTQLQAQSALAAASVATTHNPIYTAILNESLLALGKTAIEEVNSSALLMELRLLSRIEAWRVVMYNCAAMTSSESQEGNTFNRDEMFFAAKEQRNIAEAEYNRFFGGTVGQHSYANSGYTNIMGVW